MSFEAIVEKCERRLAYIFADKEIIIRSLTHSSGAETHCDSNERMEFLGDAILGYVVCEFLFMKFPEYDEGELTKIKSAAVSRDCCYKIAKQIGLDTCLITGKGFSYQKLPSSLLANALEAVIAAVYLDGGMEVVKRFIIKHFEPEIEKLTQDIGAENFKSTLQQKGQKLFNGIPNYILLDEKGPDHCKCFKIEVRIHQQRFPSAWGTTKKEAEQRAAENALALIQGKAPPYWGGD